MLHSAVLPLLLGESSAFFAFAAVVAGFLGIVGASAGFVAGQLPGLRRPVRLVVSATVTLVTTLAISSLPGLIGGVERAIFVTVAVVGALGLIEWERSRTTP